MEKALDLLYSDASNEEVQSFCLMNADDLQFQDNLHLNLFHHLAIANRASLVPQLLPKFNSVLITQQDLSGKTPAHFLAEKGFYEILDNVLQRNQNIISITDDSGRTIWHSCFRYPKIIDIQKIMMKYGGKTDFSIKNKFGVSLKDIWKTFYKEFQGLIWNNALKGKMELLIDTRNWFLDMLDENIEIMKEIKHSLLAEIALNADIELFEKYIEISNVPLDFTDASGRCILMHILSSSQRDIYQRISLLLKRKNSFSICDYEASTPLHFLIKNQNIKISEKLEIMDLFDIYNAEKLKLMLKIVDFSGDCALTLAIKLKDVRFTKTVIAFYRKLYGSVDMFPKHGLPYFFRDNDWTPYFYKDDDFNQIYKDCKLLPFRNRIDNSSIFKNLRWKFPTHPLEIAIEVNSEEIFDFLLEKGFRVNSFGRKGQMILEDAIKSNNVGIIKSAISRGILHFYYAEKDGEEGKKTFAYYDNESESRYSGIKSWLFNISRTTDQKIAEMLANSFILSINEPAANCIGSLDKIEDWLSKAIKIKSKKKLNIIAKLVKNGTIALLLDHLDPIISKDSFEKILIYNYLFRSIYYGNFKAFEKIIIRATNLDININVNFIFSNDLWDLMKSSNVWDFLENKSFANRCIAALIISPSPNKEIAELLMKMNIQWEGEFPLQQVYTFLHPNDIYKDKFLKNKGNRMEKLCEIIRVIVCNICEINAPNLPNFDFYGAINLAIYLDNMELFSYIFEISYNNLISREYLKSQDIYESWLQFILKHNLVNILEKMLELIIKTPFDLYLNERFLSDENILTILLKYLDLNRLGWNIDFNNFLIEKFSLQGPMKILHILRRIEKCTRKSLPFVHLLCDDEIYLPLIQKIFEKQSPRVNWAEEKSNPLLKACKYAQVNIVSLLLKQMPSMPSNILASAINKVSLFGFNHRHPVKIDIWKYDGEELLNRQAIIKILVNYSIENGLIDRSRPKFLESRIYNGVLLSASTTMNANTVEFLIEKGFHPNDYFDAQVDWNLKIKKSFPKEKIYRQHPIKECLLHNIYEDTAITLIKHLNLNELDSDLLQNCLYIASKRLWWDAFSYLLVNIKNSSYWRTTIWNIIKGNQKKYLKKFIELRKEQIMKQHMNSKNWWNFIWPYNWKKAKIAKMLILNKNIFSIKSSVRIYNALERKEITPTTLNIAAFKGNYQMIFSSLEDFMKVDSKAVLRENKLQIEKYIEALSSNEKCIYQTAAFYALLGVSFKPEYLRMPLPNFLPSQIQEAKKIPYKILIQHVEGLKKNLSKTLKNLLYNYIEPNLDALIIGAFYGSKTVISYIKAHPSQIIENSVNIFIAAINGFIYQFSPNFNSFYGTSSNIMITRHSQYKRKDKKIHHEFLIFIVENLLAKNIDPTPINKIKILHVLYICLHFELLTVAVLMYSKIYDLGVTSIIFGGILSECARNGYIADVKRLLSMEINPNLSVAIPSWELLPRYEDYNTGDDEKLRIWEIDTWNDCQVAAYPSALHWAAENRNEKLVDLLLCYGSNIYMQAPLKFIKSEIKDEFLVTASDLARLNQFGSIYHKIIKNSNDYVKISKRYKYPSEFRKYFNIDRQAIPNWLLRLLSAIWTGNNELLIKILSLGNSSMNIHNIIYNFENKTQQNGKIVDEMYKGSVVLNNLYGVRILKACKFIPPYECLKFSAELGRDEITIELLEIFGISNLLLKEKYEQSCQNYEKDFNRLEELYKDDQNFALNISQIREIAHLALLTLSKYTVELLLVTHPDSFTIEAFESIFSNNYSGLDIWALTFLNHWNSIDILDIEKLLSKLKTNISGEKIIPLLLEFGQRKLIRKIFLSEFHHNIDIIPERIIACKWYNIPISLKLSLEILNLRNETNKLFSELSLTLLNEEVPASFENTLDAYNDIYYAKRGREVIIKEIEKVNININVDQLDSGFKQFLSYIDKRYQKILIKVTMDYQSLPKNIYPLIMRALRISVFHGLYNVELFSNDSYEDGVFRESSSWSLINFLIEINELIDNSDAELSLVYVDYSEFEYLEPSHNKLFFTFKDSSMVTCPQKCLLYKNLKYKTLAWKSINFLRGFYDLKGMIKFDIDSLINEIITPLSALKRRPDIINMRKLFGNSSLAYWIANLIALLDIHSGIIENIETVLITFTKKYANYDNSNMSGIDRIIVTNGISFEKRSECLIVTFEMLIHNLSKQFVKISDCPRAFEEIRVIFLTSLMTSPQLIKEFINLSAFVDYQENLKNKEKPNIILEWNLQNFEGIIERFINILYSDDQNLATKVGLLKNLEWIGKQIHSNSVLINVSNLLSSAINYNEKQADLLSNDSTFILGSKINGPEVSSIKCLFEEIKKKYLLNIPPSKIPEICKKNDILLINCSEVITISEILRGYIHGNNNSYFICSIRQVFKVLPTFPTVKDLAYSIGSLLYCAADGSILYDKQNHYPNFENSLTDLEDLCEVNFSELLSTVPRVISFGCLDDDFSNINLKLSKDLFVSPILNKPKYSIKSHILGSREYKDLIGELYRHFDILRKKAELPSWIMPIYVDFQEANNNESLSQDKLNADAIFYLLSATLNELLKSMTDIISYEDISFSFYSFEPKLLWIKNPISHQLAKLFSQSITEVSLIFTNGDDRVCIENKKLAIYIPITKQLKNCDQNLIKDTIIASLIEGAMKNIPRNIILQESPSKLPALLLLSQIDRIYNQFHILSYSILNLDFEIVIRTYNKDKFSESFQYSIADKMKIELTSSKNIKIPSIIEISEEIRRQRKLPMVNFKLIPIDNDSILFAAGRKVRYINQFQSIDNLEAKVVNLRTLKTLSIDLIQESNFVYINDLVFENAWVLIIFEHKGLPIGFKIVAVGPNMPKCLSKFYSLEKRKSNEFGIIILDTAKTLNPSIFPSVYPSNPLSENVIFLKKNYIISGGLLMDALSPSSNFPAVSFKSTKIYDVTLLNLKLKSKGKMTVYFKSSSQSTIKPALDLCLNSQELLENYQLQLFSDSKSYILENFYCNLTLQTKEISKETDFWISCINEYFSGVLDWYEKPYIIIEIIRKFTGTTWDNWYKKKYCQTIYFIAKFYLYSNRESNKIIPKAWKEFYIATKDIIENLPSLKDWINYFFELENCKGLEDKEKITNRFDTVKEELKKIEKKFSDDYKKLIAE
ncbi:unnamed protein product [Blepharisma stoltei]|uniref:Ankyrin repeat protein n=1 Tax=Blepharisma stoltei TaxID=1481888 RepID=A0AAU9JYV8_9CILI|nr:unnamed protein product [Blepharisma stoltei]